jgi:molybdenum cofactor cytidylyltransferase
MTQKEHNLAMLYLAAGASKRMGRSKALLPWHGQTVISHHKALIDMIDGIDAWTVMQPHDEPLSRELDTISWPQDQRLINPKAPECDMLESMTCGVEGILDYTTRYHTIGLALIDQPMIRPETFRHLYGASFSTPEFILQPAYKGRRGHPVLLPRKIAEELLSYEGESLRSFLEGWSAVRSTVSVNDPGIITDMDTPEEYQTQLAHN